MYKLVDKHILLILSMVFLFEDKNVYVPVVALLFALIITELTQVFNDIKFVYGVIIIFAIGSLIFPVLVFFIPIMLYDFFAQKCYWGCGILISFYINVSYFKSNKEIFLWWIILILTAVFANRTEKYIKEHTNYIDLQDSSVETYRTLDLKHKELLEKQDYEIHVATLSERNRIAREIHDNVGHMLSRSILQVGALMAINKSNELIYSQLTSINTSLNEAMNNIRESVHDLHDESIDLRHSILEIVSEMKKRFDVKFDYDISYQPGRNMKFCIIAIIKEAMANTMKYSNGNKINIIIREHPAFYQLAIEDNGTDISVNYDSGIGLTNMKDRVTALNGNINFNTNDGFKIMISIPKKEVSK